MRLANKELLFFSPKGRWICYPTPLIIVVMKNLLWPILAILLLLSACGPQTTNMIIIIDSDHIRTLTTNERVPAALLVQAGVIMSPADRVLFNGNEIAIDNPLPSATSYTLQVRRAMTLSVSGKIIESAAATICEALSSAGVQLYAADELVPPANAPISGSLRVEYIPSTELTVTADGRQARIRSAAPTVGQALANAGMPLLGLDTSQPAEDQAIPQDGQIHIVRISESLVLAQESIPFQSESQDSANLELGQEQIIQPGINGLAVSRTRIRYEDGQEVSRQTESQTIVRPPQNRISALGTKIVQKTATVDGTTIQYWRVLQMYATVYSPCNSGGSGCSSGTASGLRAGKGVVAVDPSLYSYLNGQRIYVPGYGFAVIGDVGGGYIVEQKLGVSRYRWIDLGFDDNNLVDMTGWVTVYFLEPAPASIPDVLK
jgi:uncharacterized protein YabE (DUF348 family)